MAAENRLSINIRKLKSSDYGKAICLYHEEHWHEVSEFHMREQARHFGGSMFHGAYAQDGELIGTCGASILDEDNAYLDYILVAKEHRGNGFGKQILKETLNRLGNRNAILDSALKAIPLYKRLEFKENGRVFMTYVNIDDAEITDDCHQVNGGEYILEEITKTNIEEVMRYDQMLHPFGYRSYFKSLLLMQTNIGFCSRDDNGLVNGIALLLGDTGTLSAVFAENDSIAKQLLRKLFSYLITNQICSGRKIKVVIPEEHVGTVVSILKDLGLEASDPEYILQRMVTRHQAPVDMERVYCMSYFQASCL